MSEEGFSLAAKMATFVVVCVAQQKTNAVHNKIMQQLTFANDDKDVKIKDDKISIQSICANRYHISLFMDKSKAKQYQCYSCQYVCCDIIRIECDQCIDIYYLYCKVCLDGYLKTHGLRCPINKNHQNMCYNLNDKCKHKMINSLIVHCPTKNFQNCDERMKTNQFVYGRK